MQRDLDRQISGRQANGRFRKGSPGGPGRPPRPTELDYLRALSAACPPETWAEISRRAVEDARQGDPKAREWLSRYLLGTGVAGALAEAAAAELTGYDPVADRATSLGPLALLTADHAY